MSRVTNLVRGTAALAIVAGLTACSTDAKVFGTAPRNDMFASYVALGNSITAGYQSGGINDSTQKRAYPVLLASAMKTRFAYPSLKMPGCQPPVANFQTQALVGGAPAGTCALRDPNYVTDVLNNVAVPGATVIDPAAATTPFSNTLTTLFLGGKSQVGRALDADPTFATIWIGNNDVLAPATRGVTATTAALGVPGITPQAAFEQAYGLMLDTLLKGAPGIKGVLIGVVNPAAAPILFPAAALANPAFLAGFSQFAGGAVTVLPNCAGSTSLISFAIVSAMRSGALPRVIGCEKGSVPGTPVGDYFVLDSQEQATFTAAVNAYNTYIQARANAIGFAYWDPNALLLAQKANGCISTVPNLASTTAPYGTCMSLDGAHPGNPAHVLIADALRQVINTKYNTSLPAIQ